MINNSYLLITSKMEPSNEPLKGFRPVTTAEALTISGGGQSSGHFALTFHLPDADAANDFS